MGEWLETVSRGSVWFALIGKYVLEKIVNLIKEVHNNIESALMAKKGFIMQLLESSDKGASCRQDTLLETALEALNGQAPYGSCCTINSFLNDRDYTNDIRLLAISIW